MVIDSIKIPEKKRRLLSLDAFRGAIIIAMVLVNNPGVEEAAYPMLRHADWHGWTFADVIAPSFLWIIGLSMIVALPRRIKSSKNYTAVVMHILRRSVIIFILGMVLYWIEISDNPDKWQVIPFTGVLQRIAMGYLLAGMIFVIAGIRGHAVWIFVSCTLYWMLIKSIPVPGIGAGGLDPIGNAASYLDHLTFGHHGGNGHSLLSLLTVSATISFGVISGHLLKKKTVNWKKFGLMCIFGFFLILIGEILGHWIPINRRLWTPSFTVLMAGISLTAFCAFFLAIEILSLKKGTRPFIVFGINPITMFVFSEIGRFFLNKKGVTQGGSWVSLWEYGYRVLFTPIANPHNASLLFAVSYVLIFLLIAYAMDYKGWIVKI